MKRKINCTNANRISIVEFLKKNNIEPQKIAGNDFWFNSPLRSENQPSFKVNQVLNVWYDHGLGEGGTLVDLGTQMFNCSVKEFLSRIQNEHFSFQPPSPKETSIRPRGANCSVELIKVQELQNQNLKNYIKSRRISLQLAAKFLKEVHFKVKGNIYYALGFQNDSGGYELRNQYYPGTIAPKDITTIKNGNNTLAVFEGFFNFLSIFETKLIPIDSTDFLVLNSVSFMSRAEKHFHEYDTVHLFLDNDNGGDNATEHALKVVPDKVVDWRSHYAESNDLNQHLQDNQPGQHHLQQDAIIKSQVDNRKKSGGKGMQM